MEKYIKTLKNSILFEDFTDKEILLILDCFSVNIQDYKKDENVFMSGSKLLYIGIALDGRLKIEKEDINGNIMIVGEITKSDIFGEAFVCGDIEEVPVSIWAIDNSKVLYLDYKEVLNICNNACDYHIKLIKNMLKLMADKLIMQNQKISIIQKKTIREKIMAHLEIVSIKNKSNSFKIGFNRNEMADYIGVNRSALSRELSNMQKEGIINYNKNNFKVIKWEI